MKKRFALLVILFGTAMGAFFMSRDVAESQNCSNENRRGRLEMIAVKDNGFGSNENSIDAQVLFRLDNGNDQYGFELTDEENALVAQAALELLQAAMTNNWEVRVSFEDCGGRNHMVRNHHIRVFR